MSALAQTIHRNLLAFMKQRAFNNPELSTRSGVSIGSVMKYVTGARTPKPDQLAKLAEALGRDPGDFFLEQPPPPKVLVEMEFRLKAGPNAPADLLARARRYEQELNREYFERVHEEKKKPKRKA